MKLANKLISVFMSLVLFCTIVTPAFATPKKEITTRAEYAEYLEDEGYPALTTDEFYAKWNAACDFFRLMTGGKFPSEETLEISVDEYLLALNHQVVTNSGLDVLKTIDNFPAFNLGIGELVDRYQIDTAAVRKGMYALRDECYKMNMPEVAGLYHFVGVYMSVIDECYFYVEPYGEDEGIYEFCLDITYRDGYTEKFNTGILHDSKTGELYGENGDGLLGFGFAFNSQEMVCYALVNAWHRNVGYAVVYDLAADVSYVWDIVTRRFAFDYDGLEWRIQIWKGSYFLLATGAEVGLYNREPDKAISTFYNCATDDQLMMMTIKLSHKNTVLFDRGPMKHWWINGYRMNGKTYDPESLTLEFSIEMPDMEMVNAFTKAIDNEENGDTTYTVNGTTVSAVWHAK